MHAVLAILLIAVVLILLLCVKMKTVRQRISVAAGFGISIFSLFAFLAFIFLPQRGILLVLLCVFYISTAVFLVLWNLKKTKAVYFLLCVPVICVAAGTGLIVYQNYVRNIPSVNERVLFLYDYEPFLENNRLAKLDEEPGLRIIERQPVLDGATALYPVYASFAQAVYSEEEYDEKEGTVFCGGTDRAYENLTEGNVDIVFCAEPSEAQLKRFTDKGLKIKFVPIGREAFVFFVNRNNPINNLTTKEIKGIYSGEIKNWKSLNRLNQNIRAFQRPENSGSQTMLEKIMEDTPIMKPRMENVSTGMGDIINEVAVYRNFPNAIGFSFLFFSSEMVKSNQIKLLSVDGIFPTKETIRNRAYPFSGSFYAAYIDAAWKNENIELFVEWILSKQGQGLIQKAGYVPINDL